MAFGSLIRAGKLEKISRFPKLKRKKSEKGQQYK
jgi:hypothetical protein